MATRPLSDFAKFTEARVLRVQSGDVVVIQGVDLDLALEQRDFIERLRNMLGVPVIVTAGSVAVIRPEVTP